MFHCRTCAIEAMCIGIALTNSRLCRVELETLANVLGSSIVMMT